MGDRPPEVCIAATTGKMLSVCEPDDYVFVELRVPRMPPHSVRPRARQRPHDDLPPDHPWVLGLPTGTAAAHARVPTQAARATAGTQTSPPRGAAYTDLLARLLTAHEAELLPPGKTQRTE